MMVARIQYRQHHQIRKCEKQTLGLLARSFGCSLGRACQKTQMAAARKFAQIFQPDPREDGDFVFGKKFLAGSDFNQV